VAPAGSPVSVSVTSPGKVLPLVGATVKLKVATPPGWTVLDSTLPVNWKSCTVSVRANEALLLKLSSPEYAAVSECEPAVSVLIVTAA